MPPVIPAPDPAGLPAPPPVIVFFLLLTFTLHLVAMNLLVGGSIIQYLALRRAKADPFFALLAKKVGAALPLTMSLTITLGVAPLLFLQVLYGQAFYTATVLMAWPWLSVIALLMIAYYAIYAVRFRPEWLSGGVTALAGLAAVLILCIGMLQVLNATLQLLPGQWGSIYSRSALGLHLNFSDRTVVPRYLHFMVAGLAFGGLGVMLLARLARKSDHKWAERATAYGARWFLVATGVEVLVGIWFLVSMPSPVLKAFMGGSVVDSALLVLGIVAALVAMASVKRLPILGSALAIVTVAFMVVVRHRVRDLMLHPDLNVYAQPVKPQWALFVAFALILVAGLCTAGWLVVQYARTAAPHSQKEA